MYVSQKSLQKSIVSHLFYSDCICFICCSSPSVLLFIVSTVYFICFCCFTLNVLNVTGVLYNEFSTNYTELLYIFY